MKRLEQSSTCSVTHFLTNVRWAHRFYVLWNILLCCCVIKSKTFLKLKFEFLVNIQGAADVVIGLMSSCFSKWLAAFGTFTKQISNSRDANSVMCVGRHSHRVYHLHSAQKWTLKYPIYFSCPFEFISIFFFMSFLWWLKKARRYF